jgi:hypothetical protein
MAADTKCRCKLHSILHVSDGTEEKQQRQVFVMPATYCRFATTLVFILWLQLKNLKMWIVSEA